MCVRRKSDFSACLFQKEWERWTVLGNKTLYYARRRRKIGILY